LSKSGTKQKNQILIKENSYGKENIYQFKVEDLSEDIRFLHIERKKVMIVNTASKCGLTPQYKDLEAIYKEYKDKIL
jgi:glutathione peroxidase